MVTQHFRCQDPVLQNYFTSYYWMEGQDNDRSNFRIFPSNNSVLSLGWNTCLRKMLNTIVLQSTSNSCYSIYVDNVDAPINFEYRGPIYELSFLVRPQYTAYVARRIASLRKNETNWYRMIGQLQAEVFGTTGITQRQQLVEHWLKEVLLGSEMDETMAQVGASVKLLEQGMPAQHIASLLGTSRKTLHKTFRKHTLKTPGAFRRIHRFREALRVRQKQSEVNLTGVAYASGYYDQSHMVRDFRRLSGLAPKELLTTLLSVDEENVFWLPV